MAVHDPPRRVLAYCYASLAVQPTHAAMTEREFARLRGALVFWCAACGEAHTAERSRLQLEPAPPPLRAPRP